MEAGLHLRHLEVFHAVMLTGTITAAARLLNISQPAATRLLLRAEDQLGYKLFDRVRGRLAPTREGRILHAESDAVLGGLENLRKLARNLGAGAGGRLRVAAAPALCLALVPDAILRFRARHPAVGFTVETRQYADLVRAVLTQEVDVGLAFDAQPHPGLDATPIATGRFYGVFPSGSTPPTPIALAGFAAYPFVGLRSDDPLGAAFTAALSLADVALDPIVEVGTNQIALSLVARGLGAAIVDQYTAAARDPARSVLRPLDPPIGFRVHALRAKSAPASVPSRRFVAALVQAERAIAAGLP